MSDDEIISKHTKAAYKALKEPDASWTHKLKEVLLEIGIIVFAVTLSIWFHNWSESLKDRREEKEFLAALKKDLQADITEMQGDTANLNKGLRAVDYFLKVGSGLEYSQDSLNNDGWIFFSTIQINPRISRYEALKGSGRMDIVEDKELLIDITDLYQKSFPQTQRINDGLNHLREEKLVPFIEDHLQMKPSGQVTNWQDILRTAKMRLLLRQTQGWMSNALVYYNEGLAKGNVIITKIDKQLQ
jgi:hypothetical protein